MERLDCNGFDLFSQMWQIIWMYELRAASDTQPQKMFILCGIHIWSSTLKFWLCWPQIGWPEWWFFIGKSYREKILICLPDICIESSQQVLLPNNVRKSWQIMIYTTRNVAVCIYLASPACPALLGTPYSKPETLVSGLPWILCQV